jgi:alpha-L-arabinofuranosidase
VLTQCAIAQVTASAFAPLLNNVHGTQWHFNLINFNATHLYTLPSYQAQSMFRAKLGDHTLLSQRDGGHPHWSATASVSSTLQAKHAHRFTTIVVKLANYHRAQLLVDVRLMGWGGLHGVDASVLTADDPDAENTLDQPERVVPTRLDLSWQSDANAVAVAMPPWSIVVVECKVRSSRRRFQRARARKR